MGPRKAVRLPGGQRLSFIECGPVDHGGSCPTVLLLHGINGNATSWLPQLKALAPQLRMIAWDAPGYGCSEPAVDSIAGMARAALEFAAAIGTGPLAVVGHSMGGLVAMQMAIQQPSMVSRLVLSCTHPGHGQTGSTAPGTRYAKRLEELKHLPSASYGERRAAGMLPPDTAPEIFRAIAAIAAESRLAGVTASAHAVQTANLRAELKWITAPALVITCGLDRVTPLALSKPLLEQLPDVRHHRLQGLGHAPYYEDPERFNDAILPFLLNRENAPALITRQGGAGA